MLQRIFSTNTFKNQISFNIAKDAIESHIYNDESIHHFIRGFLSERVYGQHKILSYLLFDQNKRYVTLELPPYSGKTSAVYMSAFIHAFSYGKNTLIIYPGEQKREIASNFINNKIKEIYYHEFPSIIDINSDTVLRSEDIAKPQLYLTDVYSLHANILPNINQSYFWKNLGFIAMEDIEQYRETFGSNCAYTFRRLFAKLSQYNTDYKLLCTNKPLTNRLQKLASLTGISEELFESIVDVNSAPITERSVTYWYPPVNHIQYSVGSNDLECTVGDFYGELKLLINNLRALREIDRSQNSKKRIVILWQKSYLSTDDIANIGDKISIDTNEIIIGNNLDEIRKKMLLHIDRLDMSDIDVILIVGLKKSIYHYMADLNHIGSDKYSIIFFNHQTPSLQYESFKIIEDPNSIEPLLSRKSLNIRLYDNDIISQHCQYLREEYPNISHRMLQEYFPAQFVDAFEKSSDKFSGRFIYLNLDIKYTPKIKRTKAQLDSLAGTKNYKLYDIEGKQPQYIGEQPEEFIRAYCYQSGKFIIKGKRYTVFRVDHGNKIVHLKRMEGLNSFYKITNYAINNTEIRDDYDRHEHTEFRNFVRVINRTCNIEEQLLGVKRTVNYREFEMSNPGQQEGFPSTPLKLLELQFDHTLFATLEGFGSTTELSDEERNRLDSRGYRVLHTLAHLLIESALTELEIDVEELKISINTAVDISQGEEAFFSLNFIDLTGLNEDFLDHFVTGNLAKLLRISERILLNCPCQQGSWTCVRVDYCNIDGCPSMNNLDKLGTLRLIGILLERSDNVIAMRERWKLFFEQWNITETGVNNNDIDHKNRLEQFARLVMERKGLIQFSDYYNSRFMNWEEANVLIGGMNIPVAQIIRGYVNRDDEYIVYSPGWPELELYETMFHERFHNYQLNYAQNKKRNFNPDLEFFNWDNIEDPKNIPYIGLLVIEGSAVWFGTRMMELFADLEYVANSNRSRIREYLAGLHLLFALENEFGYIGTLSKLQDGFDITKYQFQYSGIIEREMDAHLRESILGSNQVGDWCRCLKVNNQLNDIQRVSFYLRGRTDNSRVMLGVHNMVHAADQSLAHIPRANIEHYANMLPQDFINENAIVSVLETEGLAERGEAADERLLCERCPSNCNLFTACMLAGGRGIFRRILLSIFPPPEPASESETQ